MKRRRVLEVCLALFGVVALGWTAVAGPPGGIIVSGPTSGSWDLPGGGQDGSAAGTLFDDTFNPVFTLGATLVETSPGPGKQKGTIVGSLKDGSGTTVYDVLGDWSANKKGKGGFDAFIGFAGPGGTFAVFGQMSGTFDDPGPGAGTYSGAWSIETF